MVTDYFFVYSYFFQCEEKNWEKFLGYGNNTLLGGMPIKFIGNSFVTFYTKHLPLEFIGNYDVCEIPLKSIGKSFNIQSNYYLRRIFPKRITGESF